MKRYLLILLLAGPLYPQMLMPIVGGGASSPPPTLIQHTFNDSAPITVAFSSPTTTGNTLFFAMEANSSVTVTSIANTGGATWTKVQSVTTATQTAELWYGTGNTGQSTDTLTIVWSSTLDYRVAYIAEFSNVAVLSPLDNHASATGNSTSAATGTFTVVSGDLLLGIADTQGTPVAGSGFTQLDTDTFSLFEYKIASSTSANVTATGDAGTWTIIGAGFLKL